jgi:hypothetical protein
LRDSNYIDIVKTCIRDTLSEYYSGGNIDDFLHVELLCNDQVFLEILKMKIRSVSITYSIRKSRDEKEKTLKLENDIQILENQIKSKSHCVYSGIFESETQGFFHFSLI